MKTFLSNASQFFWTIYGYLDLAFNSLKLVFDVFERFIGYISTFIASLPAIVKICCTVVILISVLYLIVGRQNNS